MSGEKNYNKQNKEQERSYSKKDNNLYGSNGLSKSKSLGVIILMLALLVFQVTVFIASKLGENDHNGGNGATPPDSGSRYSILQHSDSLSAVPDIKKKTYKNRAHYAPSQKRNTKRKVAERFVFDPNTISADSLCKLGLSLKQAQTILNYRNKGGVFRKKTDFAKMYVVNETLYCELEPYIIIKEQYDRAEKPDIKYERRAREMAANDKTIVKDGKRAAGENRMAEMKTGLNNGLGIGGKVETTTTKTATESVTEAAAATTTKTATTTEIETATATETEAAGRDNSPQLLDLNTADSAALVKLYGIGGHYARRILYYRNRVGFFYAPEQLMEIEGIDSVRFNGFRHRVTADPALIRKFSLDTAGKSFLIRHPYIGAYAARGIILLREKLGTAACTLKNLVKEKILSPASAARLWFYVIE